MKGKHLVMVGVGVAGVAALVLVAKHFMGASGASRTNVAANSGSAGSQALGFNVGTLNALAGDASSLVKSFSGGAQKPTTPADLNSAGSGYTAFA